MRVEFVLAFVVVACAGAQAACGSDGARPVSTPAAPAATVSRVTVNGTPPEIGQTSQLTATATLSDGSTQDVTRLATWQSSNASSATVSSSGLVTGIAPGESDISATYQSVSGSQRVVIAARTFSVSGVITDSETGQPLQRAEVQALDGAQAGKTSPPTDAAGAFTLSGLSPGMVTVRARATGYDSRDHRITLDADIRADFGLRRSCSYSVTPALIWVSLGGLSVSDHVEITTSRADCAWMATTTADWFFIWPSGGTPGHSQSGSGSKTLGIVANAIGSRSCIRTGAVQVRWSGGGADVVVRQPLYSGPEPPACTQ